MEASRAEDAETAAPGPPDAKVKFPYRQVIPGYLSVFSFFFGLFMVLPFLPFMTKDFVDRPRNELGYYAGFLASAFSLGDIVGATVWGTLADRFGRRPIMTIAPLLSSIFIVLFGFSQSFVWAIVARICWGFTASTMAVTKTLLGESSSESNRARIFALIGFWNGIARLIGPSLGALLYSPASKYAGMDTAFWRSHPYLFPCVVAVLANLATFLSALLLLKETLKRPERLAPPPRPGSRDDDDDDDNCDDENGGDDDSSGKDEPTRRSRNGVGVVVRMVHANGNARTNPTEIATCLDFDVRHEKESMEEGDEVARPGVEVIELHDMSTHRTTTTTTTTSTSTAADATVAVAGTGDGPDEPGLGEPPVGRKSARGVASRLHQRLGGLRGRGQRRYRPMRAEAESGGPLPVSASGCCAGVRMYFGMFRLLKVSAIRYGCLMYCGMALVSMMVLECMPLLMVNSHVHGGFCFNSSEIGILNAAIAACQLFTQAWLYPFVAKRLGFRRTFRLTLTLFCLAIVSFPWGSAAVGSLDPWPRPVRSSPSYFNFTSSPAPPGAPSSPPGTGNGSGSPLLDQEQCYVADARVWLESTQMDAHNNTGISSSNETVTPRNYTLLGLDQCGRVLTDQRTLLPPERQFSEFRLLECLPWWVWPAIMAFTAPLNLFMIMAFTCCNVMINNSCDTTTRARVTSMAQSMAGMARVVGPMISVLFAWSTDNGQPVPLNFHLTFWLMATVGAFFVGLSFKLPDSLEGKRPTDVAAALSQPSSGASASTGNEHEALLEDAADEEEVAV